MTQLVSMLKYIPSCNRYESKNHLYIVTELCLGGDLVDLLKEGIKFPEASIREFARDIARGLQYVHSRTYVHGNLKPANIYCDENGRLKLAGFSFAKKLNEIETASKDFEVSSSSLIYRSSS